jgi:hypothetical protein
MERELAPRSEVDGQAVQRKRVRLPIRAPKGQDGGSAYQLAKDVAAPGFFSVWNEDVMQEISVGDGTECGTRQSVINNNLMQLHRCLKQFVCELGPALKKSRTNGPVSNPGEKASLDTVAIFKDTFLQAERVWLAANIMIHQGASEVFALTLDGYAKQLMVQNFVLANKIKDPRAEKVHTCISNTQIHTAFIKYISTHHVTLPILNEIHPHNAHVDLPADVG